MAELTLGVAAVFAFVAASVYSYIGVRFSRRPVSGESKLAARMFALWWLGLAATTATGGALATWGALGTPNLGVVAVATSFNLIAALAALMGLLYYLVFLYTGRREILLPIVAFYSVFGVTLAYYIAAANPTRVVVSRWTVGLAYERPFGTGFIIILVLLLIFPQIIAALLYFGLYFKVKDPAQRFRVAVVSWSLIIWLGSALLAAGANLSQSDAWQVASRGISLGAALAIFAAYFPPRWLRARLNFLPAVD